MGDKTDENKRVRINQSNVDSVVAETVAAKQVSIANINAGKARISQAGIGVLRAHSVDLEKTSSGLLIAKNIKADRVNTLLCFSDSIEGEVKTVFSKESAILFGAAFAIVTAFLRTLRRVLR